MTVVIKDPEPINIFPVDNYLIQCAHPTLPHSPSSSTLAYSPPTDTLHQEHLDPARGGLVRG